MKSVRCMNMNADIFLYNNLGREYEEIILIFPNIAIGLIQAKICVIDFWAH